MRNNRLLITFGAEGMLSMPQGHKESYRTKTLDSAKSILNRRHIYYIKQAIFKDGQGNETTLINKEDTMPVFKDVRKKKKK